MFQGIEDQQPASDEQHPLELGVAGVALHLAGNKTKQAYDYTTDATGLYDFSGLPNDTYVFSATLGEGMLLARYSGRRRDEVDLAAIDVQFAIDARYAGLRQRIAGGELAQRLVDPARVGCAKARGAPSEAQQVARAAD